MDNISKHAVLYIPDLKGYFVFALGEDLLEVKLGLSNASSKAVYGLFVTADNSFIFYEDKERLLEDIAYFKERFPDYKVRVGFKESTVKRLTHANKDLRELFFEMFKKKTDD